MNQVKQFLLCLKIVFRSRKLTLISFVTIVSKKHGYMQKEIQR